MNGANVSEVRRVGPAGEGSEGRLNGHGYLPSLQGLRSGRVLIARQPGRQGPSSDPNRDGCGPATLRLLVLLSALVLLAGCRETNEAVSPGAYCSPAGATGTTADGTPMECTARPGDDRARWRQP